MLMSWVFSLAYASVCAYAYTCTYALVKTSMVADNCHSKKRHIYIYYVEESVLLGTKPLVVSIRYSIRDLSGVFSV